MTSVTLPIPQVITQMFVSLFEPIGYIFAIYCKVELIGIVGVALYSGFGVFGLEVAVVFFGVETTAEACLPVNDTRIE